MAKKSLIKPNFKLKEDTGYPYSIFYLSTQALNVMVDFENESHILLIKLLADQEREISENGELSKSSMNKGRSLFKKVLGENIAYSKYYGADCTFRLSSTPNTNLNKGTKKWIDTQKIESACRKLAVGSIRRKACI